MEVAVPGHELEAERPEARGELREAGAVLRAAARDKGLVIERRGGRGGADGVHVERLARALHDGDEFARGVTVAHAQGGEAVDLGKRA